jgi:hypothetical protein
VRICAHFFSNDPSTYVSFVTVRHSRPGRRGIWMGGWPSGWPTAAGPRAAGRHAGSGAQARRLTGAAAANSRSPGALRTPVTGAYSCPKPMHRLPRPPARNRRWDGHLLGYVTWS